MSRVGKQPIEIPASVAVTISSDSVTVKGPKGELTSPLFEGITVEQEGNVVSLSCADLTSKSMKSFYGLSKALLASNVIGVSTGFTKTLELRGVGYRAQVNGNVLSLSLGFSHPIDYAMPEGVEAKVDKSNIMISGHDKQRVGQVAAEIRAYRPPEPYKGKGVRYVDEFVAKKEGKRA
ncbi:MAG: 50S ribosomal protein L6 [Zetaproteobacteria bacterium]|nr:50S ribosomal protein L6 [Zetaproteobacteria bacterium]